MSGQPELRSEIPSLIEGGLHVDARGTVTFVNDFHFEGVDRFYTIRAHRPYAPRGWRGHRLEHKWFTAISGTMHISVVQPDDWEHPSPNLPISKFVLSALQPRILHVPTGYATGMMGLTEDAILLVFSSGHIQDAREDDYLFPVDTWEISV